MGLSRAHVSLGLLVLAAWLALPVASEGLVPEPPSPDADAQQVPLEVFTSARVLERAPLRYPGSARRSAREGWVALNCVVAADGTLSEVSVHDSTGQPEFETAAMEWMRANRLEPARSGTRAVDSTFRYKVTFVMANEERGARLSFVRTFRRLMAALQVKDRAVADAELAALDVQNLYEDAYHHLARYHYATIWGDERTRVLALRAAIANEKHGRYLPRADFMSAARALFVANVRASDFGSALAAYELLDAEAQADPMVAKAAAEVRALATDGRAFTTEGVVSERGFWATRLLKAHFTIAPRQGEVTDFRLYCERKFVFLKLQPEMQYTRSTDHGNCDIEIVGTPGASFALTQF